jgi:hypothetical protein
MDRILKGEPNELLLAVTQDLGVFGGGLRSHRLPRSIAAIWARVTFSRLAISASDHPSPLRMEAINAPSDREPP